MNIHSIYAPFLRFFRRRRMAQFVEMFGVRDDMRILDVGGAPIVWELIDQRPKVILLNIDTSVNHSDGRFTFVQGDARDLPYDDGEFRIVYSNSVIEHVGGPEDQERFAE